MPKIILTRTGSPLYCDPAKATSPVGEADTLALFKWLARRDDLEIVFFGRVVDPEMCPGKYLTIDYTGLDYLSSIDTIAERCKPALEALREFDACAVVDMWGYSPSWSNPDNPRFATVQDVAVRQCCPQMWLMKELKLPRFGVVTDPKCYKRDLEMATCWPEVTPSACLSQEEKSFPKRIADTPYRVHAAYGACEFWPVWDWDDWLWQAGERENDIVIASHAHVKTSRILTGRESIYEDWFRDPIDWSRVEVYGKGWEHVPNVRWNGTVPTLLDVRKRLRTSYGGPMLPQTPGFNSTKPRIYALSGAAPFLYGTGVTKFTYDADQRILPLDHPCRLREGESLAAFVRRLPALDLVGCRQEVMERTAPDFSKLLKLIDAADDLHTRGQKPPMDDAWLSEFGGYVCLR